MSTLLELAELDDIFPTPNRSFMLFSNLESTSDLLIIVVFDTSVVVPVFDILYPLSVNSFFTSVSFLLEPEPFRISIFILLASVFVIVDELLLELSSSDAVELELLPDVEELVELFE